MEEVKYPKRMPRTLKVQSVALHGCLITLGFFFFFSVYLAAELWMKNRPMGQYWLESMMWFISLASSVGFFLHYREKSRLKSIQIFDDHLVLNWDDKPEDLYWTQISKIQWEKGGILRIKSKQDKDYLLDSSIERLEYLWDGILSGRPDLMKSNLDFDKIRVDLVQSDHHHKRQLWFFKHKLVNLIYWVGNPVVFLLIGYIYQSKMLGMKFDLQYYFRLGLFAFFTLIFCSLLLSSLLKIYFDYQTKKRLCHNEGDKKQNLEWEAVLLRRSKYFQFIFSFFFFSIILQKNLNFYSITHLAEDKNYLQLLQGHYLVDKRFNCLNCKFPVEEGDVVVFGRGFLGKVLATPGETIAQISPSGPGRAIASEKVVLTPPGHLALLVGENGEEVVFIKEADLVGRLKKP